VRTENGKKAGSHPLREQVQIGRAEACHVRLDDRYSSQFHARLYPKGDAWYLEDLGSTNGTYLNRRKVGTPTEVRRGDRIKIGKTVLELRK
jgi:pSer/pThr/pTyr-binding forkhead associated (FHA) protein